MSLDPPRRRHKLSFPLPVLGFVAFSGTGKTTLLRQLIPLIRASGLRLGVIKHAHHQFDIDHPGKDSYELRKAGANRMLIGSAKRFALMVEHESDGEPDLHALMGQIGYESLDLVLVEGFKHERYDKIELHRPSLGHPLLFAKDPDVVAVATDDELGIATALPLLDLNRPSQIAEFVHQHCVAAEADRLNPPSSMT